MRQTELISRADFLSWSLGLLVVLVIFMVCVWAIRLLQAPTTLESDRLRVVSGLSLGMRERLVLVQAGKKQLILGVTPSRIEMLCLLEGEECLQKMPPTTPLENSFAYKLKQVMKGKDHA
ncbi:MAG TPA: flagellar biosynthetic protein FliO [Methylococcaceae bacterium]|nr:flagellar biosynthetic protein FliO [Methylococcaceae bacterium]